MKAHSRAVFVFVLCIIVIVNASKINIKKGSSNNVKKAPNINYIGIGYDIFVATSPS